MMSYTACLLAAVASHNYVGRSTAEAAANCWAVSGRETLLLYKFL